MVSHELRHANRKLEGVFVGKLGHVNVRRPFILSSWDITVEILLRNLIFSLFLTVSLWVVARGTAGLDVETLEELGPEKRDKLRASFQYDLTRKAMTAKISCTKTLAMHFAVILEEQGKNSAILV